jgi:protein phosphatase
MKIKIKTPQCIFEIGKRDNQEDALFPAEGNATVDDRLFILCDGMGGHDFGEVASQTVCRAISLYICHHWPTDGWLSDQLILDAIEEAYRALDVLERGIKKMGTTLALIVLHEGGCTAAHIGDSRIYHIRPSEQKLLYRSRDHSLVTDLYQAGDISYEEMYSSPQKNIITKAMQPGEDNRVKPDIVHIGNLRADDYLYLCSDGMMELMDDGQLADILCSKVNDEDKKIRLLNATTDNCDNHSAHLIHISEVMMDWNESIVDDESTSRSNFLNILPNVVDALEVDIQNLDDDNQFASITPTVKTNRKWLFLLCAAFVALFIFFYMFLNSIDDEAKQLPDPIQKIEMKTIRQ